MYVQAVVVVWLQGGHLHQCNGIRKSYNGGKVDHACTN